MLKIKTKIYGDDCFNIKIKGNNTNPNEVMCTCADLINYVKNNTTLDEKTIYKVIKDYAKQMEENDDRDSSK